MSVRVPLRNIDLKTRRELDRELRVREKVKVKAGGGGGKSAYRNLKEVAAYRVDGSEKIALPFQWAMDKEKYAMYRREREGKLVGRFSGELRPEQLTIQSEALTHLNKKGSILIAVYPGGGKTITSLSICSRIGMKTLVLVNRVVLMDQWKESIRRFYSEGTMVQVVETADEMDPSADFYIMNALNVPKKSIEDFKGIGTVIVDECHMMITQVFVRALCYVFPRYLIGLSATPYRPDGLDVLLDLYFGTERIVRKLYRQHTVYPIETGLVIEGERDQRGKLNWNSVLETQMTSAPRNDMIKRLCLFFEDRSILILCKRVQQIETLRDLLVGMNQRCATLKGNECAYDTEARILIASIQKVGTGFSHDKLDMLILACDTEEYFLQYLGRVFRRPDVVPIVIDIIDQNPVLRRHARTRRKVYIDSGGTLHDFHTTFPKFPLLASTI